MKSRNENIAFIGLALVTYIVMDFIVGLYLMSSIGISLVAYQFVRFFYDLGKRVEIRDILALTATVQWILGPALAFNVFPEHPVFYMAVDEKTYMDFMVPACLALISGLYLPVSKSFSITQYHFDRIREFAVDKRNLAYLFIILGVLFNAGRKYVPGSLEFLFFLLGNMQFVGIFLLMMTPGARFKWLIFGSVVVALIGNAVLQGMFHQLLLWMIFMFLMMALIFRFSFWAKSFTFIIGIIMIMLIQSSKDDYREQTWYKTEIEDSRKNIFKDVIMQRIENPSLMFQEEMTNNMNARLNQGWIIARIMNHVPESEPFAKGETVNTAVMAALVPRFLNPSKVSAGGHKNFERFTGTPLNKKTSMDLSLAGEAYANFAIGGGILFLFLIGLFYNWVLISIIKVARKHPTLILWIPLLFFQVVKAETDLATVLNHLVKSILMVAFVFILFRFVFNIKV